jgi:hypothetical protein
VAEPAHGAGGPDRPHSGGHDGPCVARRSQCSGRRLDAATLADPRRARETFVAVVLESELGDAATADEDLREVARRVAEQLGEDPTVGARLHEVLREAVRR